MTNFAVIALIVVLFLLFVVLCAMFYNFLMHRQDTRALQICKDCKVDKQYCERCVWRVS